jgi:hypothetical protein
MNKIDKQFLGIRNEPGSRRAMMLAGMSAAFILGALWYTVLTDSRTRTAGVDRSVLTESGPVGGKGAHPTGLIPVPAR